MFANASAAANGHRRVARKRAGGKSQRGGAKCEIGRFAVRLRVTMSPPAVTETDVTVPQEVGQSVIVETED